MSCSLINWEEFGRSQLARTALNLSQLGRREASDLAFHLKAVARKMTGPHSHRGGHWFDPSIAHQVSGYVDLRRHHGGSHSCSQVVGCRYAAGHDRQAWLGRRQHLLRSLGAATVRSALKELAATRATRTVGMAHAGLTRAIRHAGQRQGAPQRRHARGHVGWPGRPSVQVAHLRAGRCPDPGGPVLRLVRLRCPESPGRRPD
jgi:hypothetical protein